MRFSALPVGFLVALACGFALTPSVTRAADAPTPAQAQARPPQPTDPDQRDQPYGQAFRAMIADPGNLDALLRYAEEAVKVGNFEAAIGALERMLIFNPDLPRVRLELGVLYFRLQSFETAKSYLQRALASPTVPDEVRKQVETYLAEIDSRENPDKFSASWFAGVRYQTNGNAGPNGGVSRIFGTDLPLTGHSLSRGDANLFSSLAGTYIHELDTPDGDTIEANANIYGAKQFDLRQLDLALFQFDAGPRFHFDGFELRPYGILNTAMLGGAPYFSSAGTGVTGTVPINERLAFDTTVETQSRLYHPTNQAPRLKDRDGFLSLARFSPRYALSATEIIGASLELGYDATRQSYERYAQYVLSGNYFVTYDAPFAVTDQPWNGSVALSRTWRPYAGADPIIDPTTKRRDNEWSLTLGATAGLTTTLGLVLQFQQSWVDSTLPNYRYTNSIITSGLSYRF